MVLGEGACTLILENWDHAVARGAPISAEIIGFATNCDGTHLVRPNQKTMAQVIQQGLADANLEAEQIGYISGHGTATVHGDIAETQATAEVLGANIPFSSIKGYIGHSLGACGAIEAWLSIAMMNEDWFAPTLNLERLDDRCAELDYITSQPRPCSTEFIISNNFAFGGVNTSLVIRRI